LRVADGALLPPARQRGGGTRNGETPRPAAERPLRDTWTRRLVTMEEVLRFAKIYRVEKIMRPYFEAIIS
jgi:hypothetical protein